MPVPTKLLKSIYRRRGDWKVMLFAGVLICLGADTVEITLAGSLPFTFNDTHHVQGICFEGDRLFVTSVDRADRTGWIFVVDPKNGSLRRQARLALGDQIHPGGLQSHQGALYIPLAEYRPKSTSSIVVLDATTLHVKRTIPIQDHLGAIAVSKDGTIYAANWDTRDIYVIRPDGTIVEMKPNPTGIAYQDWKLEEGSIWAAGRDDTSPLVDVIEVDSWSLAKRYRLKATDANANVNFSREGFAKVGSTLWMLPEDGPKSTLYRFELP